MKNLNYSFLILLGISLFHVYWIEASKDDLVKLDPQPPPLSTPTPQNVTTSPPNTTTSSTTTPSTPPTTKPTTTTTLSPPTTTSTTTSTTSTIPPTTPPPTPTPTPTPTPKPTAAPTQKPEPDRKFDGPSFIGGIVFTLGLMVIGFISWKFYLARTGPNYHIL